MRKSIIVGTFVLVFAAGGISACESNGGAGKKVVGQAPVGRMPADQAQKVASAGTPDATPVAIHDTVGKVEARPEDSDTASKAARFTLVLGEGKSGFRVNSFTLSDDAKARIDDMFAGGKVDLKEARFEIEGYTDNLGPKDLNEKIGRARAEAVKQYLVERYEILPAAIKVTSYGLDNPVADNATPEGRALNRRVVIKVLD